MSTAKLTRTAAGFFWIGVALTVASIMLVFAHNNEWVRPFDRANIPLVWVFAVLAAVAFLATELCQSISQRASEADDQSSQPAPLMDKISKQEFLSFMETEFDRLDQDKNGELDVKALRSSGSGEVGNLALDRLTRNPKRGGQHLQPRTP
jgi:hypothetical protein